MLTPHSKSTQILLLLASFITSLFLLLPNKVNSADEISFNFKRFHQNQKDLIFIGNTSVSQGGVIRLNPVDKNGIPYPKTVGKALYAAPVHIWEGDSVASFVTTFSFSMEAPNTNNVSDGLTFYLAPPGLPEGRNGGYFGLFNDSTTSSSYHVVLVEFDTIGYPSNSWDPSYQHIGINVNGVKSQKYIKWEARYFGLIAHVEISYDAPTKTLTASLTYSNDQTSYIISHNVDLKAILPEWVTVGFTGTNYDTTLETHDVSNWKFEAILDTTKVALENNETHDSA